MFCFLILPEQASTSDLPALTHWCREGSRLN